MGQTEDPCGMSGVDSRGDGGGDGVVAGVVVVVVAVVVVVGVVGVGADDEYT